MITRLALAFGIAALALAATAAAQSGDAVVTGVVADSSGNALPGAEVLALGSALSSRTDGDGAFRLGGLPNGEVTLAARRLGFRPETLTVTAAAGGGVTVEFRLRAAPTMLAAVAVRGEKQKFSGRLGGYYERLSSRVGGTFITRDEIDRGHPSQLTDVLRRFPGVEIVRGSRLRLRGRNCAPIVWIDGVSMPAGEVELNTFAPTSLEGIEIYMTASGAPGRYQATGTGSRCGTVLLWSRGGDSEERRAPAVSAADRVDRLHAEGAAALASEVDTTARPVSAGFGVVYPPELLATGIGGAVLVEFVVDTAGRVEDETFGVVSSPHVLFSHAVYQAVTQTRFSPARRQGRAVRQIVQLRFWFDPPSRRP